MSLPRSFFTFRANRYKNDAIATHNATMVTANPIRVIRVCSSTTITPLVCPLNSALTSTLGPHPDATKTENTRLWTTDGTAPPVENPPSEKVCGAVALGTRFRGHNSTKLHGDAVRPAATGR